MQKFTGYILCNIIRIYVIAYHYSRIEKNIFLCWYWISKELIYLGFLWFLFLTWLSVLDGDFHLFSHFLQRSFLYKYEIMIL